MKLLIALFALFSFTALTFATPSELKLVSPKKLQRVRGKALKIVIELPCSNDEALDWSEVVITSDDSGDMLGAVAVVVAMDQCKKGPVREYDIIVSPKEHGYSFGKGPVSNYFVPANITRY